MKRLLCLLLLCVVAPLSAQEQHMPLRCEMSVPKSLARSQPAALTFALTNEGTHVLQILTWQTPFEGMKSAMFTVQRDGIEVEYRGALLKRAPPRKEHYLPLRAGQRREATIDLGQGWDVEAPGRYTVQYSAQLLDVIVGDAAAPRSLDAFQELQPRCNVVSFTRK